MHDGGLHLDGIFARLESQQRQMEQSLAVDQSLTVEVGILMVLTVQFLDSHTVTGLQRTGIVQGRESQRDGVQVVVHNDIPSPRDGLL